MMGSDATRVPSAVAHGLAAIGANHPNGELWFEASATSGVWEVEAVEDGQRDATTTRYLIVISDKQRDDGTFGQIPTVVIR